VLYYGKDEMTSEILKGKNKKKKKRGKYARV
jgi:hypothetical protein